MRRLGWAVGVVAAILVAVALWFGARDRGQSRDAPAIAAPTEAAPAGLPSSIATSPPAAAAEPGAIDPAAPPAITGRVADASGSPLPRARVYRAASPDDAETLVLAATADDTGEFTVLPERFGSADYTFRADDCLTLVRVPAEPGDRLEVVLERGATQEARVLDALTGTPVPRARVWIGDDWRTREVIACDESGRFDFVIAAPSLPRLATQAEGYFDARFEGYALPPRGAPLELRIVPSAESKSAIFRVVDAATEEPLASVTIAGQPGEPVDATAGLFRGPLRMSFGSGRARVEAEGHLSRVVDAPLGAGRSAALPIDARLIPAAAITGRVLDGSGEPIGDARVDARQTSSSEHLDTRGMFSFHAEAASGADGRFAIEGLLPTATYRVTIEHDAHAPRAIEDVRLAAAAERLDLGDIGLEAGDAIAGTVRSAASGEPIPNARVRVVAAVARRETITNADGAFRFEAPCARGETVRVEVSARGRAPRAIAGISPHSEAPPLEVLLEDGLAIEGAVIDENDRPLAGALVRAEFSGTDDPDERDFLQRVYWADPPSTIAAADGTFRLAGLPRATFLVRAAYGSRDGRAQSAAGDARIPAGTSGLVIRLAPPLPLSGILIRVVAARDLSPIPQFEAAVRADDPSRIQGSSGTAGWNGAAEYWKSLEPGVRHDVMIGAAGYGRVTLKDVIVEPGEIRRETVALPEEAVLEGLVRTEAGAPVPRLTLVADPIAGSIDKYRRLKTTTIADGAFAIAGLAAGEYRFEATLEILGDDGGSADVPVEVRPESFDVRAGETETIALTMREPRGVPIDIRVTLEPDDRPRWITVTLTPVASSGARRRYWTRGTRNATDLRLPAIAPGEYVVDLMTLTETDPGNQSSATVGVDPERIVVSESGPRRFDLAVVEPAR